MYGANLEDFLVCLYLGKTISEKKGLGKKDPVWSLTFTQEFTISPPFLLFCCVPFCVVQYISLSKNILTYSRIDRKVQFLDQKLQKSLIFIALWVSALDPCSWCQWTATVCLELWSKKCDIFMVRRHLINFSACCRAAGGAKGTCFPSKCSAVIQSGENSTGGKFLRELQCLSFRASPDKLTPGSR